MHRHEKNKWNKQYNYTHNIVVHTAIIIITIVYATFGSKMNTIYNNKYRYRELSIQIKTYRS